jgi:hypothetical protein
MKEIQMLEFLKEQLKHSHVINNITSIKLMDIDTDFGLAGETYLVKLVELRPDYTSTLEFPAKKVERTCMVNALEFNSWLRKKQIIKFID